VKAGGNQMRGGDPHFISGLWRSAKGKKAGNEKWRTVKAGCTGSHLVYVKTYYAVRSDTTCYHISRPKRPRVPYFLPRAK